MLSSLPLDVLRMIFMNFLLQYERIALRFVSKRFSRFDFLKEDKGREILRAAALHTATHGQLSLLEWVHGHRKFLLYQSHDIIDSAARGGHVAVLEWMDTQGYHPAGSTECPHGAAAAGHLDVLKWLKDQKVDFTFTVSSKAAQGGYINILEWLFKNGSYHYEGAIEGALRGGQMETLKWLKNQGCAFSQARHFCIAAHSGSIEVFEWLEANHCRWEQDACLAASRSGHFAALKWLRARGCPWAAKCFSYAIVYGHLEMLKWMKENDAPMADENQVFCSLAAENGHLEVLKWLREIGIGWGYYTAKKAILSKNQEMIKWLQEGGYPFDKAELEWLKEENRLCHK